MIDKERRRTGSFRKEYYVRYTLIFLLTAFIVYIRFILEGKSFLWLSDGTDQHYTALAWFGQYLREYIAGIFTKGEFTLPQWSFSLGVGDDIITTLHYYCIGDPLDLLAVFFDPEATEWLYTFLILLRLYLSGIAFSEFCFYHKKKAAESGAGSGEETAQESAAQSQAAVLTGALVYCFCGFVIAGAMKHAFFFNPFLYFPLFCLGAEKVLRRESPRLFIAITAVSALSNFYFFYMITILGFLYTAVRFFDVYRKGERLKGFVKAFPAGVGAYLLGTGIAAVLFLPVVLRFLNNPRYIEDAVKLRDSYTLKYLGRMVISFTGPPLSSGYWNFQGYASIAFMAVILLFTTKWKRYLTLKVFFVLGVVMMAVPFAGYALNGFAYMSNRWLFGFALLVGYICAEMVPELLKASRWRLGIVWLGAFGLFLINLYGEFNGYRTEYYGLAGVLLLMGLLVIYRREIVGSGLFSGRLAERIFCVGLVAVTICSVGVNANYHYKGMIRQYPEGGTYYANLMDSPLVTLAEEAQELEEGEFFRIDGYIPDSKRTAEKIVDVPTMEEMMAVFTGTRTVTEAEEEDDTVEQVFPDEQKAIRSYNTALLAGYNGLSAYYSLMNPYYSEFIIQEDVSTSNFSAKIASLNARMAMNALLGVKYRITLDVYNERVPYGYEEIADFRGKDGTAGTLYENRYALPLGFTYDTYILQDDISKASGLRRQQLMLTSVILEEEPGTGTPGSTTAGLKKAELIPREDTLVILEDGSMEFLNRKDWVIFDTEVPAGAEVYLYIEDARFRGASYCVAAAATEGSLQQCTLYAKNKKDYFGRKDILMNLGYYEDGLTELAFTMSEVGTLRYDKIILYYVFAEETAEKLEARGEEPMTDIEIGTNRITGKVTADQDKLLFLSVPYSSGFQAEVNGEPVKIYKAYGMFMAIEIPEGESEIVLTYSTPGLRAGAALSAVCLAGWIAAELILARRRKRKGHGG